MSLNKQKYLAFTTMLQQLRSDISSNSISANLLRQHLTSLRNFFQQDIVSLTTQFPTEQSYQTEISKQLQLLEIDIMFFQGARQAPSAVARVNAISERLTTLIGYCDAILKMDKVADE
ncbi:MAG: heterocyst frequency control protein PatD [Richelia sp. RM2_1_2]|nr:heterocyst frequency control protein PatD [Richelia sp. SM2_1_7]NJM17808.1 heterocyst frequency control protein PatD [Richelia sp. SM1_7_0]NJN08723.1 heterocyst frequency control protein PatD [Richelia sp. RM1_1_1]NJO30509.1 heterocyst frequency control protein PatD [Richelia sp. SL_2_1]NJO58341.1 heterocyst frequency control protein PatD [Richelia sp. RM2_1_2]